MRRRSDGNYYWENGTKATDLKWRESASGECVYIKDGFLQGRACDVLTHGGCSTKAAGNANFLLNELNYILNHNALYNRQFLDIYNRFI